MGRKMVQLELTAGEAAALYLAAANFEDDSADIFPGRPEASAAFGRALAKLQAARGAAWAAAEADADADEANWPLIQESDERASFNDRLEAMRGEY